MQAELIRLPCGHQNDATAQAGMFRADAVQHLMSRRLLSQDHDGSVGSEHGCDQCKFTSCGANCNKSGGV